MNDKITPEDVLAYEHLVSKVPAFVLKRMAKRNTNLVAKFQSQILPRIEKLNERHRNLLDVALESDVEDIQNLMREAFVKSDKKQFEILADPEYSEFIKSNLDEARKLLGH